MNDRSIKKEKKECPNLPGNVKVRGFTDMILKLILCQADRHTKERHFRPKEHRH